MKIQFDPTGKPEIDANFKKLSDFLNGRIESDNIRSVRFDSIETDGDSVIDTAAKKNQLTRMVVQSVCDDLHRHSKLFDAAFVDREPGDPMIQVNSDNDFIIDYDELATTDPGFLGQVYRDSNNHLLVSAFTDIDEGFGSVNNTNFDIIDEGLGAIDNTNFDSIEDI